MTTFMKGVVAEFISALSRAGTSSASADLINWATTLIKTALTRTERCPMVLTIQDNDLEQLVSQAWETRV